MSQISVTISADNKIINYGNNIPTLTLTYTIISDDNTFDTSKIVINDSSIPSPLSCSASSSSNAGSYDITLDTTLFSAPGYIVAFTFQNGTLTINKANLTITADNKSKDYDRQIYSDGYTVSYTGFVNNEIETVLTDINTLVFSGTSSNAVNAGNAYTIIVSGSISSDNYNISYINGTLTINKVNLTISADNKSKNYDGFIYSGDYTVSYTGFVHSETTSVLSNVNTILFNGTATSAINAGNAYTIIPSGSVSATNYNILYTNGTLTINKVSLTITADNKSKDYNRQIYSDGYTVIYSGFVNNQTSSVLAGTLVYSTGSSYNAINTGIYDIIPSGLTSNNYDISFVNGILTINKVSLTISAVDKSMTYTGSVYPISSYRVSYSGFVNSETETVLTGTLVYSTGISYSATNVGTYNITPSGLTSTNYNITFNNGTLTINKKALTVVRTIQNRNYNYGDTNIDYTQFYSFNGLVDGESSVVVSGIATIYLNNATISSYAKLNVGNYNVTINDIGSLSATNYSFNENITNSGTAPKLIIDKIALTVSPIIPTSPSVFTYGNTALSVISFYTISGYVLSDTSSSVSGYPTISLGGTTYAGQTMNAGTYNISVDSVSGLSSSNYSFSISNPTTLPQFVVNKKNVTISFNGVVNNIGYYNPNYPYYGSSTIQSNIYQTCLSFSSLIADSKNSLQYVMQGAQQVQTIKFKKSDDTLINSTDLPGSYTITIDTLLLTNTFTNYIFTLSPSTSTYTLKIPKGYLTVSPVSPSGTFKYGDKPSISNLYQITGFIASGESAATICSGTPTIYITPQNLYNMSVRNLYTSTTIIKATTNKISIDPYGLSISNSSNYSFFNVDYSIAGTIVVSPISLSDANITFNWTSYLPTIAYGNKLTSYHLNAIAPLNPYTRTPIGTISYKALQDGTTTVDTTSFYIGSTPNVGTFSLKATLNVTDTNYTDTILIANNNSYNTYKLTIIKNYPKINHWNPAPINRNSLLTSTELSAISNSGDTISYYETDGTELNIGDQITNDIEILEKINNYNNSNFYSRYTFRKINLFTNN